MESAKSTLITLDDDRTALAHLVQITSASHNIRIAATSRQALSWLENDRSVSGLIVEQVLKQGRGMEVLKLAKVARPDVRRILTTGYADLSDIVLGVHSGVINRIISKPFRPAEVLKAISPEALANPANNAAAGMTSGIGA